MAQAAITNDYDAILNSLHGDRFYNAIIQNSPRVWTSRATNGSYCEELDMGLSASYKETSCRYISYKTWVKLANTTDGDVINQDPDFEGLIFDTKVIKRYPMYFEEKDENRLRSPCDDVNCNSATHVYQHEIVHNNNNNAKKKSRLRATLIGLVLAIILIIVITVPIVATRHGDDNDTNNSQWDVTKY